MSTPSKRVIPERKIKVEAVERPLSDALSFLLARPSSVNGEDEQDEDANFSFQAEEQSCSDEEEEGEEEGMEEEELPKAIVVQR